MQKKYFILILALYIVIVVGGGIVDSLTEFMIPSSVVEMEKAVEGSPLIPLIAPVILLGGIIGLLACFVFGGPRFIYLQPPSLQRLFYLPFLAGGRLQPAGLTFFLT